MFNVNTAAIGASKGISDDSFESEVRKKCASNLDLLTASSTTDSVSAIKPSTLGSMLVLVTEKPEKLDFTVSTKVVNTLTNLVSLTSRDGAFEKDELQDIVQNAMS